MDEGQIEGFVAAAERDYRTVVDGYCSILGAEWHWDEAQVRQARADVLAAQQVLLLAREELRVARRREGERSGPRCLPIGESGQWLERGEGEGRS